MATSKPSKSFARLLAKSTEDERSPRAGETLCGHTMMVLESARVLLDARGESTLHAHGLSIDLLPKLRRIVLLAAALHDLGKANDQFQRMLRNKGASQLVRHEALSWWLCAKGQPLHEWLVGNDREDGERVLLAALMVAAGHHRKFTENAINCEGGTGAKIQILLNHMDFATLLRALSRELHIGKPPSFSAPMEVCMGPSALKRQLEYWEQVANLTISDRALASLVVAAKPLLIAADVAGSTFACTAEKFAWLRAQLERCRSADEIEAIVAERLNGKALRPFQEQVRDASATVTLVRAGCGSGKTVAAYAWAARQHPNRALWVTYPTTGTAAEGYRGYLNELVKRKVLDARLESGRAVVDYEIFSLNEPDNVNREFDRLDALRVWGEDVIACTVDTVLGLLQNHRKGHYAWPSLAQSAVVFDEIHAYDDALFGALMRWLEALPGIPALLMTASLPDGRLRQLESVVHRVHGRSLNVIDGPETLETLRRYRLRTVKIWDEAFRAVVQAVRDRKKVLWVSNTVDRCIAVAGKLLSASIEGGGLMKEQVLVYHSRFRYEDRVQRHRDVVAAFDPAVTDGRVACTTQVAEMSLDLSADLLLMDLAPVSAMIQRLGRLNRRSDPDNPAPVADALVLPFNGPPYDDRAKMQAADQWVRTLEGRESSQRDLIGAWNSSNEGSGGAVASKWLDSHYHTEVGDLRESDVGMSVLLPDDVDRVQRKRSDAVRCAVPMMPPKGCNWLAWRRVGWLPVPPVDGPGSIEYDPFLGARWRMST
jgi:CRISPR-associated endonuclease/helicase Cas3